VNSTGNDNTALGYGAGYYITGSGNTAVGRSALSTLTSGATGSSNTAVGFYALQSNTTASESTAVGYQSMYNNTTGIENVAMGFQSLRQTSTGTSNTAVGHQTAYSNTTGTSNVAMGRAALYATTTGGYNTAIGKDALQQNTTASFNTAVGFEAGYTQTTADYNTFIGYRAGKSTTGDQNTFIGKFAGNAITSGTLNTIIGAYNGNQGGLDIRTSSNHIVLSDGGGTPRAFINANGSMVIGNYHIPTYNNTKLSIKSPDGQYRLVDFNNNRNVNGDENLRIQLGSNCSTTASYFLIATIDGVADKLYMYGNGTVQNATGSYGAFSDIKLKENIVDATPKLDKVMQLQVRNFNMIGDELKQIGFVAQEIEQVFPGLVDNTPDRDSEGNTLETVTKGVKTSVLIPILVKAIQELKTEFDEYKRTHP
jgi:hypothetical protein